MIRVESGFDLKSMASSDSLEFVCEYCQKECMKGILRSSLRKVESEDPYQFNANKESKKRTKTPRKVKNQRGFISTESGCLNPLANMQGQKLPRKPGTVIGGQGFSHVKGYNNRKSSGEETIQNYLLSNGDDTAQKQQDIEIFVRSEPAKTKQSLKGQESPKITFEMNAGNIYTNSKNGTSNKIRDEAYYNLVDSEDDMKTSTIMDENLGIHTDGIKAIKQQINRHGDLYSQYK